MLVRSMKYYMIEQPKLMELYHYDVIILPKLALAIFINEFAGESSLLFPNKFEGG